MGYTAVLVIVILELVFAFGIGVGCILFSFNLVRSVYSSNDQEAPLGPGDFPKSKLHQQQIQQQLQNETRSPMEESLLDYSTFDESGNENLVNQTENENQPKRPFFAIIKIFTDYIRIF